MFPAVYFGMTIVYIMYDVKVVWTTYRYFAKQVSASLF